MQLTPFCLMLSCLRVSPNRSQFFRYDTITLTCEDQSNSTSWKVKRETPAGGVRPCSSGWGSTSLGSTCIIGSTYPSDSGVYWCESVDGEQSNGVNITITDRDVILESPALPVSQGAAMTLRCKAEANSNHVFNFYKDEHLISSSSTGEMTIPSVSKADEGLYKCNISGGGESAASWLAVEASPSPSASPPAASCSVSVFRLLCHVLVGTPYLVSTILLGLIYRDRKRAARTVGGRRGSNDVIMEIVV
ncbi:low affinity immunoglobulin gamma Fc region receptor II isoform X3 [Lates calcarifer]|uniref:low affinity immunoglobulin gamma Fc region receptor II isoform X3 n=1 Tax=Lates calcarifer TaxID=8187 RepID=UPI000874F48A|nr:low affinity immunoglobulin gamma Fc region receptor II isoform X3 [Lates calcarifer]